LLLGFAASQRPAGAVGTRNHQPGWWRQGRTKQRTAYGALFTRHLMGAFLAWVIFLAWVLFLGAFSAGCFFWVLFSSWVLFLGAFK
jgi:hypothetical protein